MDKNHSSEPKKELNAYERALRDFARVAEIRKNEPMRNLVLKKFSR